MDSKYLQIFFSSRAVTVAVILIAIAARIFLQIHFLNTDNDKSYQIQAAKNFLNGHGFSLYQVFAEDLSAAKYVPLTMWPPGYSLLLSPFMLLFDNDFILATLFLDSMTCIFFVRYARKLIFLAEIPVWIVNIYSLVTGFFIFPFCTDTTSDFLALTFFIAGLYYLIQFTILQKRRKHLIIPAFLLFMCGFLRYQFFPIVFTLSICFILFGILTRNRNLIKNNLFSFGLLTVFTFIFFLVFWNSSGSFFYLPDGIMKFSPENIIRLYPFLWSSLFNVNFFGVTLERLTGIEYNSIYNIFTVSNIFLFLLLLYQGVKLAHQKINCANKAVTLYLIPGFAVAVSIIFFLVILSLYYIPLSSGVSGVWLHMQEGRFYSFSIFFFQQLVFIIPSLFWRSFNKLTKMIFVLVFSLISFDFSHNLYYISKNIISLKTIIKNKTSFDTIDKTNEIFKKVTSENPDLKISLVTHPAFLGSHGGIYYSIPAFYSFLPINSTKLHTNKKTIILFITNNPNVKPVFTSPKKEEYLSRFNNYYYYLYKDLQ